MKDSLKNHMKKDMKREEFSRPCWCYRRNWWESSSIHNNRHDNILIEYCLKHRRYKDWGLVEWKSDEIYTVTEGIENRIINILVLIGEQFWYWWEYQSYWWQRLLRSYDWWQSETDWFLYTTKKSLFDQSQSHAWIWLYATIMESLHQTCIDRNSIDLPSE